MGGSRTCSGRCGVPARCPCALGVSWSELRRVFSIPPALETGRVHPDVEPLSSGFRQSPKCLTFPAQGAKIEVLMDGIDVGEPRNGRAYEASF